MFQGSLTSKDIERFHNEDHYNKCNGEMERKAREWFYSPAYGKRIRLYDSERDPEGISEEAAEGCDPGEEARTE